MEADNNTNRSLAIIPREAKIDPPPTAIVVPRQESLVISQPVFQTSGPSLIDRYGIGNITIVGEAQRAHPEDIGTLARLLGYGMIRGEVHRIIAERLARCGVSTIGEEIRALLRIHVQLAGEPPAILNLQLRHSERDDIPPGQVTGNIEIALANRGPLTMATLKPAVFRYRADRLLDPPLGEEAMLRPIHTLVARRPLGKLVDQVASSLLSFPQIDVSLSSFTTDGPVIDRDHHLIIWRSNGGETSVSSPPIDGAPPAHQLIAFGRTFGNMPDPENASVRRVASIPPPQERHPSLSSRVLRLLSGFCQD